MSLTHIAILMIAAFAAGAINSIAGGGTLITFPVLIWLGLDPNDLGLGEPPLVHLLIAGGIKLSIPARDIAVERSEEAA